ncbi:hypothetical protein BGX38DRAFT_1269126 [Terfezia claveryi]|nr:hypothetical protein BGX38DRAFT_1269126 [Terfezia claveryi]
MKGDVDFTRFPKLIKPTKWGYKPNWTWYSVLVRSKVIQERLKEDIKQEMMEEYTKDDTSKMLEEPENLPSVLDTMMLETQAEWIGECLKKHSEALINVQKKAEEKNMLLMDEIRKHQLWLANARVHSEKLLKNKEIGWLLERFIEDSKSAYRLAESHEQEAHVLKKEVEGMTRLEVIGGFVVFMEYLKSQPFFKELVAEYEARLKYNGPTRYPYLGIR